MSFTEIRDQLPRLSHEERMELAALIARMESANGSAVHPSLKDIRPVSVGKVLRSFPNPEDDLLDEMLAPR